MRRRFPGDRGPRGFSLFDLIAVTVIIVVTAAFGVPRFLRSVEKAKAAEAFGYLSAVREAQELYWEREGTYACSVADLQIEWEAPLYFDIGVIAPGSTGSLKTSWRLPLVRVEGSKRTAPFLYTVTFTEQGFDPASTIDPSLIPVAK